MAIAQHAPQLKDLVQTDKLIDRKRGRRAVVAFASPVAVLILGYILGIMLAMWFGLPAGLGYSLGLAAGAAASVWLISRSTVENDVTGGFVTTNQLASLLNRNPIVCYGPGKHFSFWWEARSSQNVVNLVEAAVPFTVKVQTDKGDITMKVSTRFRPDICRMPQFVSGAAAVASDVTGLISSFIVQKTPKTVMKALTSIAPLNKKLEKKFKHGSKEQGKDVTEFEERFGVIIGDTTIEEVLPSADVQKTMSAITEMEIINTIVANSFAHDTVKELEEAIDGGKVSRDEVNRRRTQIMAASGNLQGMELKDITFTISGLKELDPETAKALAAGFPLLLAWQQAKGSGGKKGGDK